MPAAHPTEEQANGTANQPNPEQVDTDVQKAAADVKQAVAELERAEHDLERAESELQEAEAHHHAIHFTVDGEPCETEKREMTPNEIIREFGNGQDATTHYLIQLKGHEKISYQGKGNEPVKLHDGMQFQIVSLGPTPVSDGPIVRGVPAFVEGLRGLGYASVALPGKPDHVVIDYSVPVGRFAGQQMRLGFIVPPDFPEIPPSGPHVSPHIHPIKTDGGHPNGAVHRSHSEPFERGLGGLWQYWSRPLKDWVKGKKTVAAYMSHIWRLWATQ